MDAPGVVTGSAWREFCDRLAAVGDELLGPEFPGSPQDRAEGFRHLANQVACWTTYALGSSDPASPLLFRHNDLVYRWGGPNIDQNARRAVISGSHSYRLSGSMGSCEEFAVQVKRGEMHTGDAGVDGTLWASDLGLGPGDSFDITIGPQPDATLRTSATANLVHVRDFYYHWTSAAPASFALERTDRDGEPPPPLSPERVADILEIAATQVENSIRYWRDYQAGLRAETGPNRFSEPGLVAEGVADMVYAHAFVRLEPDEALVITVSPDDAAHWNLQLYLRHWYEPLDFANRVTHLNEVMVEREPDGSARLVIAATDPGVPNWLDNEGRAEVMATSRWTKCHTPPTIDSSVVKLGDLDHSGQVSTEDRRAVIARRASHVASRYRA
jgi:hypothetical protein